MYQVVEAPDAKNKQTIDLFNQLDRLLAQPGVEKGRMYVHEKWDLAVWLDDPLGQVGRRGGERTTFRISIHEHPDGHFFQCNPLLPGRRGKSSGEFIEHSDGRKYLAHKGRFDPRGPDEIKFRERSSSDRWIRVDGKEMYIVTPIGENLSTTLAWMRGALDDYIHAKTGEKPDPVESRIDVGDASDRTRTSHRLNTVLFGPPGTGKTYETIKRCVEICDGHVPDGQACRKRYDQLVVEGRVCFVTFHQSFGYEEFVEGIRPNTTEGQIEYRIEDGILKSLAGKAAKTVQSGEHGALDVRSNLPSFDVIWVGLDARGTTTVRTKKGTKYQLVPAHNSVEFRPLGGRKTSRKYSRDSVRKLWRLRGQIGHPDTARPSEVAKAWGTGRHGSFLWTIYNELWKLAHDEESTLSASPATNRQNFVLVIDEINRANISKVMGELITLLEEDKREGAENEVTVTLPYSRESFTLPRNLHILGTMNTADRSIALLDTALRRRFQFEEMSARPDLLKDAAERTKVDLPSVISAINERLEYLVDRDHLIGHAWFMDVEDRPAVDAVMRYKIIPLIAEYFYDDWSKVQAVLGGTSDFVKGEPLGPPPGLNSIMAEERHRWTVQETFAPDAYDRLIGGRSSDEGE